MTNFCLPGPHEKCECNHVLKHHEFKSTYNYYTHEMTWLTICEMCNCNKVLESIKE